MSAYKSAVVFHMQLNNHLLAVIVFKGEGNIEHQSRQCVKGYAVLLSWGASFAYRTTIIISRHGLIDYFRVRARGTSRVKIIMKCKQFLFD